MSVGLIPVPLVLLALYIYWNDTRLKVTPTSASQFGPKRCTPADVRTRAKTLNMEGERIEVLPPKTGRRYIVVGGVRISVLWKAWNSCRPFTLGWFPGWLDYRETSEAGRKRQTHTRT